MKLPVIPVESFEDATLNFENLQQATTQVWYPLAFNATNWANFGSVDQLASYMLDANGFVHVRGLIKSVAGYAFGLGSAVIGTLPPGFRPALSEQFTAYQQDTNPAITIVRINVTANGNLTILDSLTGIANNGIVTFLTLQHIMFQQAQ